MPRSAFFSLLVVLVVIAGGVYFSRTGSVERAAAPLVPIAVVGIDCQGSDCAVAEAVATKDLSACASLTGTDAEQCKTLIAGLQARDSNDTRACASLEYAKEQETCRDEILFKQAVTAGDTGMCKLIGSLDSRTRCLAALGL